jgi:hypothetical protein
LRKKSKLHEIISHCPNVHGFATLTPPTALPHLTMNLTRFPSSHCHNSIPIFEDACIFVLSFVRMVKLDPVMFSIVHKKGEDNYDSLTWDEVFKRFVGKRIKTVFETFTRM